MVLNDAVTKDLAATTTMLTAGSPKLLYTSFLLGLIREYFSLIMSPEVSPEQIERGFITLVSFCPDAVAREQITAHYDHLTLEESKGGLGLRRSNAAMLTVGMLVDYLSECLDLTETSEGGFL